MEKKEFKESDFKGTHSYLASQYIEKNTSDLTALDWLKIIYPMAKGYAWEHQVGNNQKIIQHCRTFLEGLTNEPTDNEKWNIWAEENNICRICGSERNVCGGEEKHG